MLEINQSYGNRKVVSNTFTFADTLSDIVLAGCSGIRTNAAERLIVFLGNAGAAIYFKSRDGKKNFAFNLALLLELASEVTISLKRDLERRTRPFMAGKVILKGTFLLFFNVTSLQRFDNAVCETIYALQYYSPSCCPSFQKATFDNETHFPLITGDYLTDKLKLMPNYTQPSQALAYVAHRVRTRGARLGRSELLRAYKTLTPDFSALLLEVESLALRLVKLKVNCKQCSSYPNQAEKKKWLLSFLVSSSCVECC